MAAPKSSATRRRRALKPASPVKIVGDYGLTKKQLAEIYRIKIKDLNAKDEAAGIKIIAGTARNMGIEVLD